VVDSIPHNLMVGEWSMSCVIPLRKDWECAPGLLQIFPHEPFSCSDFALCAVTKINDKHEHSSSRVQSSVLLWITRPEVDLAITDIELFHRSLLWIFLYMQSMVNVHRGAELLGHRVQRSSAFVSTSRLFSKVVMQIENTHQ
jgi:hypothetical protein